MQGGLHLLITGAAALLFAAMFFGGRRAHPLRAIGIDDRSIVSFTGGMSAAYVFVHLMPEMSASREAFVKSVSATLRFQGMAIYFIALIGFLVFYGLDHLRKRLRAENVPGSDVLAYRINLGGFAAYVGIIAYLLVHLLDKAPVSMALYAVAMACHFLTIDHSMAEEHGEAYDRVGRNLLGAAALFGWVVGELIEIPRSAAALLLSFVSGAVIMNSMVTELPAGKTGHFGMFILGGLIYGTILLPLG